MATSMASALNWWARTKGEETALVVGQDYVSYRALQDWTSRTARFLVERGVSPGDRVGLVGSNSLEWCVAALSVVKAGAVLVPLNARLAGAELNKIIGEAGAKVVLCSSDSRALLDESVDLRAELDVFGLDELVSLRSGGIDDFRVEIAPDDPVMLLFTSGTTGLSKGVICTNHSLLGIVFEASLTEAGLRPGARTLLLLPLAFTPGLVWGLSMTIVLGGLLVVENEFVPSRAVEMLQKYEIGALFGVPLIFEAMATTQEFEDADLSSLRTAITGGAPVPVPLLQKWSSKGVELRQIYGLTEVGGVATATLARDADDHPDTCGTGSVFTEFRLVRPDDTECDPGEPGEIILRGPGVTPGYWKDPDTTDRAIRGGWLYSGDLGVQDEDGRLKFVERLKDLIISGGINISPVEIEQAISEISGVEEVAVISANDEKFGETPAAIIVAGAGLDVQDIVAYCSRVLGDYKVPRYVVRQSEPLPRLPSGKLAKAAIREQYADIARDSPKVR